MEAARMQLIRDEERACSFDGKKETTKDLPRRYPAVWLLGLAVCVRLHIVRCELRKRIGRSFFKPRQPAAENKFHAFRRSIALLGNLELRLLPLFRRSSLFKKVRSVDEHDHVSVLLNRARFAQIRKLRPAIIAFRRTRQLAK